MSIITMAAVRSSSSSSLNPNAPLFIPAAYQQVDDFSPEWWDLVKTTGWFRDHWFRQHQEQENFDGSSSSLDEYYEEEEEEEEEYDDVASLLPDSFDVATIEGDFSGPYLPDEAVLIKVYLSAAATADAAAKDLKQPPCIDDDVAAVMKTLCLKSPKKELVVDPAKYREKPVRSASPKFSPRRIIHQPR